MPEIIQLECDFCHEEIEPEYQHWAINWSEATKEEEIEYVCYDCYHGKLKK